MKKNAREDEDWKLSNQRRKRLEMKEAGQLLVKHEAELNYEKIVERKKARKEKDLQQRDGQKIGHEDNAQNKD